MWELDYKESWMLKNWCFWTVVLEKTLESPLDCNEIQPVHPKGNQSWIFIERTDAEAPILWPPDRKNRLIGKDPDAGKDWRQEEKGRTEDEMVGWPSPTRWTWVSVNSGSWWWTGKPGMLQSMGFQSVRHKWATQLTDLLFAVFYRVLVPSIAPLRFFLLAVVLLFNTIMKLLSDFIIHIDDLSTLLLLIPLTFSFISKSYSPPWTSYLLPEPKAKWLRSFHYQYL